MKFIQTIAFSLLAIHLNAQEIPKKINVPPPHADPNVVFTVLNFEPISKDQFSVLSYYQVGGSVLTPGEFVQDTGQIVFKDKDWKEVIPSSNGALLIKKQIIDIDGKEVATEVHFLALRKLEPASSYKIYFYKSVKDPVVTNRSILTKSIYNVQDLPNMTEDEQLTLAKFCAQFIPVVPNAQSTNTDNTYKGNQYVEPTVVDDYKALKKQFQAISEARQAIRGDLPRSEKYQTRFSIEGDLSFAITKTRGETEYLKFYLSADNKTFECLDSAKVKGDLLITSIATVFNMKAQAVGAFANFSYKFKDEKGEEISRQYSFVMSPDFKIYGWVHSTGKDKLNSLAPEMCWFENNKLFVLSDNRERIFKPYAQVHEFTLGGESKLIFPANEEEKGTEKTKYTNTFQPPVPINASQASPIPEKYVPLYVINSGNTKYFIAEGVKYNDVSKVNEYLTVKIYRFESNGKLTNIDILSDYRSINPFPLTQILKNDVSEYYLLEYPIRVQLAINAEKTELSQLTDEGHYLVEKREGGFVKHSPYGSLLLKKQGIGNKMQLLFYP